MKILSHLNSLQENAFFAIKHHAEQLLDYSPRFKYFTLHGRAHIDGMIGIADMLVDLDISLSGDEAYLLLLAICMHDLGMVVPLRDKSCQEIFRGQPQVSDPTSVETFIRDIHHNLVISYVSQHFDFLTSLGVKPADCGLIKEIARSHRRVSLSEQTGLPRKLGALLRIIDELDIGPERAPVEILRNNFEEMDATSCWHWFKHNIVDPWRVGHNIQLMRSGRAKTIRFELIVRPPNAQSIPYWLNQIKKPMHRVLDDERASGAISEYWGVTIQIVPSNELSKANPLGSEWEEIEKKALSHGRRVILLIDDEVRKMEDLLLPLLDEFHIIFAPHARDALTKVAATKIDLAIVDMQIGSGGLWNAEETENFKATGKKLCEEIKKISPETKLGILTGTRYNIDSCENLPLEFLIKKPVDPEKFEGIIYGILR